MQNRIGSAGAFGADPILHKTGQSDPWHEIGPAAKLGQVGA